jgi:hypothetical protein
MSQLGIRGDALIEQVRQASGVVDVRVAPGLGTNSPTKLHTIGARSMGEATESLLNRGKVQVVGGRVMFEGEEITEEELEEIFKWVKKARKTASEKYQAAKAYLKNKAQTLRSSKLYQRTHKIVAKQREKFIKRMGKGAAKKHKSGFRLSRESVGVGALDRVQGLREQLGHDQNTSGGATFAESPYADLAVSAGYLMHLIAESIMDIDAEIAAKLFDAAEEAADFSEQLDGIEDEDDIDPEQMETLESLMVAVSDAQRMYEDMGAPCAFSEDDDEDDDDEDDDEDDSDDSNGDR